MNIFIEKILPPDTFQMVNAISCCLIDENNAAHITISNLSTIEQTINNFLNVIKWLGVDVDFYQVVNDDTILFINGSKIIFELVEVKQSSIPEITKPFDNNYSEAWQGGK